MDLEAVHAVLGLDVDHLAAGLAPPAVDRRRDHPVTMGVSEDHHPAADIRVRDQISGVEPPTGAGRPLVPELANLACSDADHGVARYSLRDGRRVVILFANLRYPPWVN